jgi:NTP pyrophosphatase (non-canonical NTP hydrolase)
MLSKGFELDQFIAVVDIVAEIVYNAQVAKGFYEDSPTHFGLQAEDTLRYVQEIRTYLGNKLMLMVTEIAEAHEAIRKNLDKSEHIPEYTALEEEIADTVIRILDFSGYNKLRLGDAIKAKLIFNQSRPHKHGKQF